LKSKGQYVDLIIFDTTNVFFKTNLNLINLGVVQSNNPLLRLRNIFRRIILLNKIIKEGEYTDVVIFLSSANFYNALLKNKQVNTIVSIRNYKQDSLLASKIFNRFIYSRVDRIVVVSEKIREKIALNYQEETQKKLITIYNK
jgi:hypothetical protein